MMLTPAMLGSFWTDLWMPADAGGFSENVDWLFMFIFVVCVFFTVLIGSLMVVFSIKYRQKDKHKIAHGAHHSTLIELGWTIPPLLIVLIIFVVGFNGYLDMTTPPEGGNAYAIRAVAKKWGWDFYYPEGVRSGKEWRVDENGNPVTFLGDPHVEGETQAGFDYVLYVPNDRPTEITLESNDVLHSLFLPSFRIKKDVVPGRFNTLWFEPDPEVATDGNPAEYPLYCTEYCGQGHSQMSGKVIVMTRKDFDAKMKELDVWNPEGLPPVELGKAIHASQCASCHSPDGSAGTGPTWKDLWGDPNHLMNNGTEVLVDEAYIVESIRQPSAKIVAGFAAGQMAPYNEQALPAGDVAAIIEFMKSIDDEDPVEPLAAWPEGYDGSVPLSEFEGEAGDPATAETGGDEQRDEATVPPTQQPEVDMNANSDPAAADPEAVE
jgi:cytochrome c oxidase subunit 2